MSAPEDTPIVVNREELVSHGRRQVRADALAIIEAGIRGAHPARGVRRLVSLAGDVLRIGDRRIDLSGVEHVWVVGAGKASLAIARALEGLLGERISGGIVAVKRGQPGRLERIEVRQAGHPVPDDDSVAAARRLIEVLDGAGERDLVLAAVTGGASALATLPPDGVELADVQAVTGRLLNCGAVIQQINTVRRHLCRLKGGRLVAHARPAEVVTFTLDTVHAGMPWPDMCLPDPTTFQDAIDVLEGLGLWQAAPRRVREFLAAARGREDLETLKSLEGARSSIVSVGDPVAACEAAAACARRLGYAPAILATGIEGEARHVGTVLAAIASEIAARRRPFAPPCAVISGGETTVTVRPAGGRGGPNQETVLAFALGFAAEADLAFVSVDTDGTDGPTDIAGGIADGLTRARAEDAGIDLAGALRRHDSTAALTALGDAVVTGHTGTNVMNLRAIVAR